MSCISENILNKKKNILSQRKTKKLFTTGNHYQNFVNNPNSFSQKFIQSTTKSRISDILRITFGTKFRTTKHSPSYNHPCPITKNASLTESNRQSHLQHKKPPTESSKRPAEDSYEIPQNIEFHPFSEVLSAVFSQYKASTTVQIS